MLADLHAGVNAGESGTWLGIVIGLTILYSISQALGFTWIIYFICVWALTCSVASKMRNRFNIVRRPDGCTECLTYFFCLGCFVCQMGRQLENQQDPVAQELIVNIKNANPCCGSDCVPKPV